MAEEEEKETWLQLITEFSGSTTFHGLSYIFGETVFFIRRVIWIILTLIHLGIFIALIIDRAILLSDRPRAIDLDVIYTDNMDFPSVTFCNQNLFRKSAAHNYGMFDIIQKSFSENGELEDKFEISEDTYIDGLGSSSAMEYYTYSHVTIDLCKDICEQLKNEECCSLVYIEERGDCYITPLDPLESNALSLKREEGAKYLKRKSCKTKSSLECDFENLEPSEPTPCDFVIKQGDVKWRPIDSKIGAENVPHVDRSDAGNGTYMHVSLDYRLNEPAEISTRDMLIKEDTCLQFWYQVTSGIFMVNTSVNGNDNTEWKMRKRRTGVWEYARLQLHPGYQKIKFLAAWDDDSDAVNVSIDAINIDKCTPIDECIRTPHGLGYEGTTSITLSGTKCQRWDARDSFFKEWTDEIKGGYLLENYCRNPDGDRSPWCFVNHKTGQAEYCNIPTCQCGGDESFMCDNNVRCLDRRFVCDGYSHCDDGTDEIGCENVTVSGRFLGLIESGISVNCTFDGNGCGYQIPEVSKGTWTIMPGNDGYVILQPLDHDDSNKDLSDVPSPNGSISAIASPPVYIETPHCLEMNLWLKDAMIDIYAVRYVQSDTKEYIATLLATPSETLYQNNTDQLLVVDVVHLDLEPQTIENDNISSAHKFHLLFKVVYNWQPDNVMLMDNITLWPGTCEELERTTLPPPTTEFTTVPFVENKTESIDVATTDATLSRRKRQVNVGNNAVSTADPVDILHTTEVTLTSMQGIEGNTTDMWDNTTYSQETTTEPPPTGGRLVRPVTNTTLCKTCKKELGDKYPQDCPLDPEGIACSFNNGCGCGYSYFSTNSYFKWIIYHPDMDNATDPNMDRDSEDSYAKTEAKPYLNDRTTLMSPIENVGVKKCLVFLYMTKYANLTVNRYSDTFSNTLLSITMDAQDFYWHRAQVTVEAGTYGISFEFQYDDEPPHGIIGIDDVTLLDGECLMLDEGVGVNCSFEEFDICGYKDVSPSSNNWFRSKGYQDSPGTQYFMRTRKTSRGKMSRKLLSPEFDLEEDSCLEFYYFMQSYRIDDLATFAVSLVDSREFEVLHNANNTKMVWVIRSITDNLWHKASARLEAGTYGGLMFEINGDEYRGGIAEVFVTSGECPDEECLDEQYYKCGNGSSGYMACIPGGLKCNSLPNCDYGLDETSELNCPVPEFKGVWTDDQKMVGTNYDALSGNVVNISSLTEMYTKLGPIQKNFITNCSFGGQPCNGDIIEQTTDYGLCFTFNGNFTRQKKVKQTGASYGLSLTLNIEQDEYIVGPNPDAGIKMFLHPANEIPQVKNLGFAVAPGTHTLVGIMRNEAYNLPIPWGDCSEIELEYFDTYGFPACELECLTKQLLDQCGCIDAYMPQINQENQPFCTTEQYFECVVPFIYKGNSTILPTDGGICQDCPKPCYQNIYEGSLSYAVLSKLSVDTMLREELKRRLERLRQTALATQYRTSVDFIDQAQVGQDIVELFKRMLQITDRNFANRSDTVFRTALVATEAMADQAINDVNTLFGKLQDEKGAYEKLYSRSKRILEIKLDDVKKNLNMIQELYAIGNENSISGLASLIATDIDMALDIHKLLMKKFNNKTFAAECYTDDPILQIELNKSLPIRFFQDEEICLEMSSVLESTLTDVKQILIKMTDESQSNLTRLTNSISDTIVETLECFSQYYNTLKEVDDWLQVKAEMLSGDLSEFTSYVDAMDDLVRSEGKDTIDKDYVSTKKNVLDFIEENMEKDDQISIYLKRLKGQDGIIYYNIKRFLTQMKSRVSDPSTESINEVKGFLLIFYQEALRKAAQLEVYLGNDFFYSSGVADKMVIWKIPAVNRKDYSTIKNAGQELWKIWPSGVTVTDFLSTNAKQEINKGLNNFFNDIIRNLEKFATDLGDLENDFSDAFDAIDSRLERYVNQYNIDHIFIQENFLKVDVYYKQLNFQQVNQTKAYEILDFLSDFGGYLGLFLGGSVLSMFELFDFCIFNGVRRKVEADRRKKHPKENDKENTKGNNGFQNKAFLQSGEAFEA